MSIDDERTRGSLGSVVVHDARSRRGLGPVSFDDEQHASSSLISSASPL